MTQQTFHADDKMVTENVDYIEPNHEAFKNMSAADKDKAMELLRGSGHSVVLTPENNKKILRKIDLYILPVILFIYFLQALDKATLAYASVFGLVKDTHLVGHEYSWLGAIVYLAQLVAQPALAYVLVKFPLGKFLAATTLLWGISLTCMTAAHNFSGLLVSRLFLGLFEAGVAPAFIALTQMWWRRREQTGRLGAWYAMNGVTNIVGSVLTFAIAKIHSEHLHSYQIIFLFFGLITVAYSAVVYFFLPDSPMTAKFLDKEEKLIAIERLRANQQGVSNDEWNWAHVRETFFDFKSWMWGFMMFSVSVISGGISTFGPLIVKSFGFDSFHTILFNMPFGAVQLVATLGGAWIATKLGKKSPVLILLCLPAVAGCVMLLHLPRGKAHRGPLLAAYYLISVYPAITPLIYSWSAANTAGETKKKVTTAFLFVFQCAGNVLGPNLYTTAEAPLYRRGLLSNLSLFIVLVVLFAANAGYVFILNKKHASRRVALGKPAHVVDRSMLKVKQEFADGDAIEEARKVEEHAFEDKTDFENEDFIYVY